MMFTDPKTIQFETKNDVVDYITKGFLPPRKEHFNQIINKVRTPDVNDEQLLASKRGNEVIITENVIDYDERETVSGIITRVYNNRIKNRNRTFVGIGLIALIVFFRRAYINNNDKMIEEDIEDEDDVRVIRF